MISDRMDINRVIAEMRSIKAQAQSPQIERSINPLQPLSDGVKSTTASDSFGNVMSKAINHVDSLHKTSNQLATAYEKGQAGVDITDVMIASQKASVSFQAMLQVRNKMVDAYRDVMNMPV
ncbi:MAG: flagellar hook-basal body complex protein FliE [Granulosicoccus sp.]|jgi:flagellar hook-basal body complex protein FliE